MTDRLAVFTASGPANTYVLSDPDIEMCARGLWGEKHADSCPPAEASAILWCWMSRFMLWPGHGQAKWGKLHRLISAHSQPVNPAWLATGAHCLPGGKGFNTIYCSKPRLAWREKVQTAPWRDVPQAMRDYAGAFARGELPNDYPEFVNFASNAYAKANGVRVAGGEWFLTKGADQMSGWKPGVVGISEVKEFRDNMGILAGFLLGAVALGLLVWGLTR